MYRTRIEKIIIFLVAAQCLTFGQLCQGADRGNQPPLLQTSSEFCEALFLDASNQKRESPPIQIIENTKGTLQASVAILRGISGGQASAVWIDRGPDLEKKIWILGAGHSAIQDSTKEDWIVDKPASYANSSSASIGPTAFVQITPDGLIRIPLKRIVFAVRSPVDVAMWEADLPQRFLVEKGLTPWKVVTTSSAISQAVVAYGLGQALAPGRGWNIIARAPGRLIGWTKIFSFQNPTRYNFVYQITSQGGPGVSGGPVTNEAGQVLGVFRGADDRRGDLFPRLVSPVNWIEQVLNSDGEFDRLRFEAMMRNLAVLSR